MRYLASLLIALAFQCNCTPPSCCEDSCDCCVISKPDPIQALEQVPFSLPYISEFKAAFSTEFSAEVILYESILPSISYYLLGSVPQAPPLLG